MKKYKEKSVNEKCIFDFGGYTNEPYHHNVNQWAFIYETEQGNYYMWLFCSETKTNAIYHLSKKMYQCFGKLEAMNGAAFNELLNTQLKPARVKLN